MQKSVPILRPRILLIEDDEERIECFRSWIRGTNYVLIEATTGGQAIGVVRRDAKVIAGICLDHDLNTKPKTQSDEWTSGSNVVTEICNHVPRTTPILVHSMNTTKGSEMHKRLLGAGYSATRTRMAILTKQLFDQWLEEVSDNWESL